MPLSTEQHLERSRRELLDLSTRNRLLSIPVGSRSAQVIQVSDEKSDQVFRLLVIEKKALSFLSGRSGKSFDAQDKSRLSSDAEDAEEGLSQPGDDGVDEARMDRRHTDARLQTSLSSEGLQSRLLALFRNAQTMIEEQGVNILYLALGNLKWLECDNPDVPRFAPLVLVPVEIHRKSASDKFYIRRLEEDVQENLSLRAKLKADFNIDLPDFPDEDDFDLLRYFDDVKTAISGAENWELLPNAITLGFFSFAKFLMFRDLDPENWPEGRSPIQHPFITALLQDGFPQSEAFFAEDMHLDTLIPADRLDHVVDADSSQSIAIEMVRQGRSIVIQGPPGTGKSQSITNIIATAVLDGKTVLFVAEKLAALEVVKRRLNKEGLGDLCLELHSNKSNKRAVVEEVGRTWKLGKPIAEVPETLVPKLERSRAVLNHHANILHQRSSPSELTPYAVIGELVRLGSGAKEVADLNFTRAEGWTPEIRQECRRLMGELEERIREIGVPAQDPWRGIGCDMVLKVDLDLLETQIRMLSASLGALIETLGTLAVALKQPLPSTFPDVEQQVLISRYVETAPHVDKQAFCSSIWNAGLDQLSDLLKNGKFFEQTVADLAGKVADSAWEEDFSSAREHIAAHGRSWLRIFNGNYRRSLAKLRGVSTGLFPKAYDERLTYADQIIAGQRSLRDIRLAKDTGQTAFGEIWRGEKTDWRQIEAILTWVAQQRSAGLGEDFRILFAEVQDHQLVARLGEKISKLLTDAHQQATSLCERLNIDFQVAFHAADLESVPLPALAERSALFLEHMEDLARWNQYFIRAKRGRELGCGALIDRLESGAVSPEAALDCFDRIYFSQLIREFMRQNPELAQFDGVLHDRRIGEFRNLDMRRLRLSRHRVLAAHFGRMPPVEGVGPAGIVKGEMERKRGHRTVRRLLKDAGTIVQAIKPVFMMSPLSVAQFLEPGALEFDLLVVDEASQVQPVDALGAIARCRQIVVVGDSQQLPPTRFFMRMTSEATEDEEELETGVAEARDIESILGLCSARGLPQTMLRWHYRSRHHSLIAVSNHEFYKDRLFIVPSPHSSTASLGLRFHHIDGGVFDCGASGTNRIEAKAVCKAVIEHALQSPELSLGVAAFSVRQQQALLDELESLRREHPETESFFSKHPDEPFFIKNLENVQGDERDIIFISVGYGKDSRGYMAMRFGPLSIEGGERRLNVLISRAKKRCEVFSSILADDIDLGRASGKGVAALKTFLNYAKTGQLQIARHASGEEESPFEEAVRTALESSGHIVESQVGIAGFYIDLAVRSPDQSASYILGIECDGASYHSLRSARDRDRLRQTVLVDHGWAIHRIWSADWLQRPKEQLRKVLKAVEDAHEQIRQSRHEESFAPCMEESNPSEVEREIRSEEGDESGLSSLATPYYEANFPVERHLGPHEVSTKKLASLVFDIVKEEGPVHEEEVLIRVRNLWGLGRAGSRTQDSVAKAIRSLQKSRLCIDEKGFLSLPDMPVPIRNRDNVASQSLRKPEMLPPAEIRAAILALIDAHHGATEKEIPLAVARIFGFRCTSGQLRSVIAEQTVNLIENSVIREVNGMLKLSS